AHATRGTDAGRAPRTGERRPHDPSASSRECAETAAGRDETRARLARRRRIHPRRDRPGPGRERRYVEESVVQGAGAHAGAAHRSARGRTWRGSMSHLSRDTLARLGDEPPTAAEAEHLENCAECRRELEEQIALTAALGDLPDLLPPPPGAWPALAERLRREGLVRPVPRARRLPLPARRAAAAVLIFVAGG